MSAEPSVFRMPDKLAPGPAGWGPAAPAPTLPPLTHHEIFRVAECLLRAGLKLDAVASDRAARRLVFIPGEDLTVQRPQACGPGGEDPARWRWQLDHPHEGHFNLARQLWWGDTLLCDLHAQGPEPEALLCAVQAQPPHRQWQQGPGWLLAFSRGVPPRARDEAPTEPVLERARLIVQTGSPDPSQAVGHAIPMTQHLCLDLRITHPRLRSMPADLELGPPAGWPQQTWPEDLLALLGWDWTRLQRHRQGYTSKLRLRGTVQRRSRIAEQALATAGGRLAALLSAGPQAYHPRHRAARWGAMVRRGIPSLTALAMVIGALLLPLWVDPQHMGPWLALHYLPIALLALAFKAQELPRFEIPPWPRPLDALHW